MKILLDSNVLLGDIKFAGTHFSELFTYLKRTACKLVLPALVVEEVLERYEERLRNVINQTRSSWVKLGATRMTEQETFPYVDVKREVQVLRERLLSPAPGVEVLHYSDVSGIDVNEIARRGIKRKRPANNSGEQLRDVILWLCLLQYVRDTGREIALVTGDEDFRESKDSDALHPDLRNEIQKAKRPIHFHRELSSFVTSQSLRKITVDDSWVSKYLTAEQVQEKLSALLLASVIPSLGIPQTVKIDALEFTKGALYDISDGSSYAELVFRLKTTLTFFSTPQRIGTIDPWRMSSDTLAVNYTTQTHSPSEGPRELPQADMESAPIGTYPVIYSPNVAAQVITGGLVTIDKAVAFDVSISLRIESKELVKWQVDELRLAEN